MWSVKLTDSQRDALRSLIKAQGEVGPSLSGAMEALEFARWDDLPEAELPWDRVSELATAQGCDEADVVWDLAAGMRVPRQAPAKRAAVAKRAARPTRAVYRRAGRPCRRCGVPIRSRGLGELNRTAYWCERCQRGP